MSGGFSSLIDNWLNIKNRLRLCIWPRIEVKGHGSVEPVL